ncbi:hypothetical protein [Prosthecobacter sp.]|jgi:hypothetical protein|uniref:hypothetical protein n=1 Tax=Prosthecobacter sp. TaxID=1965333 RepID=UPI0037C6AB1F
MKTYIVYFIDGSKVEIQAESYLVIGAQPVIFSANKVQVALINFSQIRAIIDKSATVSS